MVSTVDWMKHFGIKNEFYKYANMYRNIRKLVDNYLIYKAQKLNWSSINSVPTISNP